MTEPVWNRLARKVRVAAGREPDRLDATGAEEWLQDRWRALAAAAGVQLPAAGTDAARVRDLLAGWLVDDTQHRAWVAHMMLRGELPLEHEVIRTARQVELDGPAAALEAVAALAVPGPVPVAVHDEVVVDIDHTSKTDLATGIQRVVRMVSRRWVAHDPVFVGWNKAQTALVRLGPAAMARALGQPAPESAAPPGDALDGDRDGVEEVVVPIGGVYVLLELAVDPPRTARLLAMARFGGLRTAVVTQDCIPVTSAETAVPAIRIAFTRYLAAVREMDCVATTSCASTAEMRGWRRMLVGAGRVGPDVQVVGLPVEAQAPAEEALAQVRSEFMVTGLPMVLCVGSHEPRKNHLGVLAAAERCWARGARFSLLFVGGNSWNSAGFEAEVARLQKDDRPVETVRSLPDAALWAAYRLAHCTLFPSLNEGFGLPVGESLASGTPAITSNFGSMAEIVGDGGGAILVDPHDDVAVADALERLVTDHELHARLSAEAAARPIRTWDDYAEEAWAFVTDGR